MSTQHTASNGIPSHRTAGTAAGRTASDSTAPTGPAATDRGLSRASFLRWGATAAVGAGVLGGAAAASTVTAPAARAAGTTERLGPITGPGLTTAFRMEATDVGIPVRCPDGRVLYVFGDTFEKAGVGLGNAGFWRSPTGLYTDGSHPNEGIAFTGAVGGGQAEQMIPYEHNADGIGTRIPADVIAIDGVLYMYVWLSGTEGFGTLKGTEVWSSGDNGATWQLTGARWPADAFGGILHNITWELGEDRFVYLYASKYRNGPLHMFRVHADRIGDAAAYEPWGFTEAAGWAWGHAPTPIRQGTYGEMCLRKIDGRWLLCFFESASYNIQALVVDKPWSDLTAAQPTVLLHGGAWGAESNDHVAQLYGGYVVPGSTLADLHLTVSQWNTTPGANDTPYHTEHFRFRGVLG